MKRLLTIGSFAVPHIGHAAFLRACEGFGRVHVGVNSDTFVKSYRGVVPIFSQAERMALIGSLGYPVLLNDGPGDELIAEFKPDVLAIGSDWMSRDYYRQINLTPSQLEAMGISLVYIPMRPIGISSSEVMRRCRD